MVHILTGQGTEVICDWFNLRHKICSQIVSVKNWRKMLSLAE